MLLHPSPISTSVVATLLHSGDGKIMPWKDGGGMTREIARFPLADTASSPALADPPFAWRISIAEVAASSAFSRFPGYDRTLILLHGGGMTLRIAQEPPIAMLDPFARCDFAGEASVHCILADGPVQDFNVMVARGRVQQTTEILHLSECVERRPLASDWAFLHCGRGAATIVIDDVGAFDLAQGDTLRIDNGQSSSAKLSIRAGDAPAIAVIAIRISACGKDRQSAENTSRPQLG